MKTELHLPSFPGLARRLWMCLAAFTLLAGAMAALADWPVLGELSDILYANNRFVAVGSSGKLVWSTDGNTWTKSSYSGSQAFVAVVHTGSQFVALAEDGTLVKSTDGNTWSSLGQADLEGFATGLAYGQGVYVIVDGYGYIYASRDGVAWTAEFKPSATADEELHDVVYASNHFVAVGIHYDSDFDSYGLIRTSTTGFSWTRERQKLNEELYGISYADGLFWAVGIRFDTDFNSYSQLLNSATGSTWTQVTVPGANTLHSLTPGNNILVAGGDGGSLLIREGTTWSQRWSGSSTGMIAAVAYGAGKFVAVGESGIECLSPDGLAWFGKQPKPSADFSAIIAAGNVLVVGGEGGIWISEDQKTWANTYYGPGTIKDITYNNGTCLAVGYDYNDNMDTVGVILRSTTGRSWEAVRNQVYEEFHGVSFGKGLFIAVGSRESGLLSYDLIMTSPDGRTWTSRSAGTGTEGWGLNALQFASSQFIAVGDLGTILSSADGINWKPVETDFMDSLYDITYGQNQFVAVGAGGKVLVSNSGLAWSQKPTGKTQDLQSAVFQNGTLFCAGEGGVILKSSDLTAWLSQSSGSTNALASLCVDQDQVWVAGKGGTLFALTTPSLQPASLELKRESASPASLNLIIRGQPGSNHRLEHCDALGISPAWILEKSVQIGQDGAVTIALPREMQQRFYRCQAE